MLDLSEYLKIFIGLLAIINPIGAVPLFISMTHNFSQAETKTTSNRASLTVAIILLSALFLGGDDLVNNGQKATHLLNIYGREYDEVKKYATGIKYAHVVTYNKRDNVPDSLTKDLVKMLGFEHADLLSNFNSKINMAVINLFVYVQILSFFSLLFSRPSS